MRNCFRISAQYASSFLSSREWSGRGGVFSSWAKRLSRKASDAAMPVVAVERKWRRLSTGTSRGRERYITRATLTTEGTEGHTGLTTPEFSAAGVWHCAPDGLFWDLGRAWCQIYSGRFLSKG